MLQSSDDTNAKPGYTYTSYSKWRNAQYDVLKSLRQRYYSGRKHRTLISVTEE